MDGRSAASVRALIGSAATQLNVSVCVFECVSEVLVPEGVFSGGRFGAAGSMIGVDNGVSLSGVCVWSSAAWHCNPRERGRASQTGLGLQMTWVRNDIGPLLFYVPIPWFKHVDYQIFVT